LVVGAVLSVAQAAVSGTMETTPCPVQASEHPAAMMSATVESATVESATVEQLTFMGAIQAVRTRMR
jgi:hypothetical protein